MGRQRGRTFTGCWKCRTRKVKCDETKPECLACQRLGVTCSGYGDRLVWVEDDEAVVSKGRRVLPCESTWKGFQSLSGDLVDFLIYECDEDADQENSPYSTSPQKKPSHNPFSVFTNSSPRRRPPHQSPEMPGRLPQSIPQALVTLPTSNKEELFLFHHYVNHIANIMMPYEHPRNPWKSYYPATALELASSKRKALYSAMLSQAAFNMAHLRGNDADMLRLGSKHYGDTIKELLGTMGQETLDFPSMIASIMTLMFAELYSGSSRSWRHHFDGAWTLLAKHCESEPWKSTDLACVSLQSLNIIKIIGDTSKSHKVPEQSDKHRVVDVTDMTAMESILSTSEFGFTIGAPRIVLDSIARITDFRKKMQQGCSDCDADAFVESVLSHLNQHHKHDSHRTSEMESPTPSRQDDETDERPGPQHTPVQSPDQRDAFVHATYIYLYRSILNVPPEAIRSHVQKTFELVTAFFSSSNGNFSTWPAFIAAVEAYVEEDMAVAREWLTYSSSLGIGSRESVRLVVEETWRRREAMARASGIELGLVSIDWRDVMRELDCDVLLV